MSYSARFTDIMPWLLDHEGRKYENDPDDDGGPTKFGIDHRSHPMEDIRNLTEARATEIYWNEYWQKNGIEQMAGPFGECFFNVCVNAGRGRADQFVKQGGSTAPAFMSALEAFYRRLAAARPKSAKYLKGWLARCTDLRKKYGIE